MRRFGLIGFPLGHSFSEKYFREKFAGEGIADSIYENFPIESIKKLPDLINEKSDLCGLNVTIPYKTEVIRYLNSIDQAVAEIGSANVIKIKRTEGRVLLKGFNSDIKGISDSILPVVGADIKGALVLGSGGSSNAVSYILKKMGLKVFIVSRKPEKEQISYSDITGELLTDSPLIVNTTPLGMYPDISSSPPINYNLLSQDHILFDLVYNPEITSFLKKGLERGCRIITGLNMLYSQAERSWEIWNDDSL
jgi:shikimate dehydrogenase